MSSFGHAMRALRTAPGMSNTDVDEIAAGIMRLAESIEPMEPIEIGAECVCCWRTDRYLGCTACQSPPAAPVYMWTSKVKGQPQWELCAGCCAEWRRMAQVDPANGPLRIAEIDSFEGPNGERLWFPR